MDIRDENVILTTTGQCATQSDVAKSSWFRVTNPWTIITVSIGLGLFYTFRQFRLWYLTSPIFIDPWIYWGTAENDQYIGTYLSSTYYFRRWPLILPNRAIQSVLEPLTAQLVYRSVVLSLVAICLAFLVYRNTKRLIPAFVALAGLFTNEYLVRSIGTSYTQGMTLLAFVILLILVVQPQDKVREETFIRLVRRSLLLGFVSIIGFAAYPFFVWIALPTILFSIFVTWGSTDTRISVDAATRVLTHAGTIFVGILLGILFDLLVGRWWGYPWENVFTYSVRTGDALSSNNQFSTVLDIFWKQQMLNRGSYSLLLGVLSIALLVLSIQKSSHFGRLLSLLGLTLVGVYTLIPHMKGSSSPLVIPQTNIFLPFATVVLTAQIVAEVQNILERGSDSRRPRPRLLVGALVGWFALSFLVDMRVSLEDDWYYVLLLSIVGLTVFIRRSSQLRDKNLLLPATGVLLLFLSISCERVESAWAWGQRAGFASKEQASTFMRELSSDHRKLTEEAVTQNRRLWLLDNRPHGGWSTNISALYGLYSALTVGFPPAPAACTQVTWILGHPNSTIVIFGSRDLNSSMRLVREVVGDCAPIRLSYRMYEDQSQTLWLDISHQ